MGLQMIWYNNCHDNGLWRKKTKLRNFKTRASGLRFAVLSATCI